MPADGLLLERGTVTSITLNRPGKGNRVDDGLIDALAEALAEIGRDSACRLVVIRGAGAAFCTGREPGAPSPSAWTRRASLARIARVNTALQALSAVTVAAVNGDALGFGCGLAVLCDISLAVETAQLGFPEIAHGLAPTIVMSYLPRYVPRKLATELVLTGRTLSAREAERSGLVTRVVGDLEGEVQALVESLLALDPLALTTAKQFLVETQDMRIDEASRYGLNVLAVMQSVSS